MKTRNDACLAALLSGALLTLTVPAWSALAHPGHKGSERLLKLDLGSEPARFSYALILEADAAAVVRKQADRDGDQSVSELESKASLEALTRDFTSKLTVCHGPTVVESKCHVAMPEQVLRATAEGWGTREGTLALSWDVRIELAEDDAVVRVEEAWPHDHVVSTAAVIEPHPERPVSSAGAAPEGSSEGVNLEFNWSEAETADRPRTLYATWQPPADARPEPWMLGALTLVALVIGLTLHRRVRSVT